MHSVYEHRLGVVQHGRMTASNAFGRPRLRSTSLKEDPTPSSCMTLKGCVPPHTAPWPTCSIGLRARRVATDDVAEHPAAWTAVTSGSRVSVMR